MKNCTFEAKYLNLDILKIARDTIEKEATALHELTMSLDEQFVQSIDIIESRTGKIICTGIGKSALIAQKIVATLNSTGNGSIFMHAADAVHGDLGLIHDGDVVIAISKSGETSELKLLIPIIKSFGISIIAMTANKDSFLARMAQGILHTPITKEADPNNLAPTTSTTLQSAMGDAVAIVLLSKKGFSPEHFAKYHPGGLLGKQLYLKVSDILMSEIPPTVYPDTQLKEILLEMSARRFGAAVVVDKETKEIQGIITDGDLRRFFQEEKETSNLSAVNIMKKDPQTVNDNDLAFHAFELMKRYSISQLPVIKNNKYTGMIHLHDLLREGFV